MGREDSGIDGHWLRSTSNNPCICFIDVAGRCIDTRQSKRKACHDVAINHADRKASLTLFRWVGEEVELTEV